MTDHRRYAPATARNRDFILDVLRDVLPATGTILEVASGSGEHITHFARNTPSLVFQPSDPERDALLSVAAWVKAANVANVRAPIVLGATVGLIRGAAAILPPGSPLYLYSPYKRKGFATAPSNEAFDRNLRDRNPAWGLRDLEAIAAIALSAGFSIPDITEMPANNLSIVFRRM